MLKTALLERAAIRGAAVVVDDCHLQPQEQAALGDALARYPGKVRWVVVLPHSEAELQRRRAARDWRLRAVDERAGASLPGLPGKHAHVEFAEGRDVTVFHAWRQEGSRAGGRPSATTGGAKLDPGTHSFFRSFGDAFLSTEGSRRL